MRVPLVVAGLAASAASLSAQAPERAAFLVRLGSDTIAVERVQRSSGRLDGEYLVRQRGTRLISYHATIGPDGSITRIEVASRTLVAPQPPQSSTTTFTGDSLVGELHRGDSSWTVRVAAKPGTVPFVFQSFGLYEQAFRQLVRSGSDSAAIPLYNIGAPRVGSLTLTRHGQQGTIDFFGSPIAVTLDGSGRIRSADGAATTVKIKVERLADVDIDALGAAFAKAERDGHGLTAVSPRDTITAQVKGMAVTVDYSRPHVRGRKIFGGIVPWNEVWRTGADAATQITLDHAIVAAGRTIPAGKYTLWTLPTPTGATLIINSETGQWGTDYKAEKDFVRVPLVAESVAAPVEVFTIAVEPAGNGGQLTFSWDRTRYRLPFEVTN